jgi:hypothetical protein
VDGAGVDGKINLVINKPRPPEAGFSFRGSRTHAAAHRHSKAAPFAFVVGRAATRARNATHESADLMIPEAFTDTKSTAAQASPTRLLALNQLPIPVRSSNSTEAS